MGRLPSIAFHIVKEAVSFVLADPQLGLVERNMKVRWGTKSRSNGDFVMSLFACVGL